MNKRLLAIILVMLLMINLLSGCWDYTEYEKLALVFAIGIDVGKTPELIDLTIQYLIPSSNFGSSSGGNAEKANQNVGIITATDVTIGDAIIKIQQCLAKKPFFSYAYVMVVGEDAAKSLLHAIQGVIDRSVELRTNTQFVVTKGRASDALSTIESNISSLPGYYLSEMINSSGKTGTVTPVSIQDFLESMQEEGIEPKAPLIDTIPTGEKSGNENTDNSEENPSLAVQLKKVEGYHSTIGMAVFKGTDYVGSMDTIESEGLSMITGRNIVTYESVVIGPDPEGRLVFKVSKLKSKIKIIIENGKPSAVVDIHAEANLNKYTDDLEEEELNPDVIEMLQNDLSDKMRSDAEAALKKGQTELKSDVFGFGQTFYRQHLSTWKSTYQEKWNEIFPDLPVSINVNVKLVSTGTSVKKLLPK